MVRILVGLVVVSVMAGCAGGTPGTTDGAARGAGPQDDAGAPPRLVLQITVDQLRGDLPTRYFDRLGQGGPRYVWEAAVELARACRRKGVTLPATDLLIAACADYHSLGLLHHDRHFDEIARAR